MSSSLGEGANSAPAETVEVDVSLSVRIPQGRGMSRGILGHSHEDLGEDDELFAGDLEGFDGLSNESLRVSTGIDLSQEQ